MNKFNKLYITNDNPYKRFVLTQQGEAYFRKYFPVTDNDTIAQNLGCSKRAVVKFAQTLGIKKDATYISQCCRHVVMKGLNCEYEVGERIAQAVIMPIPKVEYFEVTNDFAISERDKGGLGSTGKN